MMPFSEEPSAAAGAGTTTLPSSLSPGTVSRTLFRIDLRCGSDDEGDGEEDWGEGDGPPLPSRRPDAANSEFSLLFAFIISDIEEEARGAGGAAEAGAEAVAE